MSYLGDYLQFAENEKEYEEGEIKMFEWFHETINENIKELTRLQVIHDHFYDCQGASHDD